MHEIAVAFPAYRNPDVLRWSVESILVQSHTNVRVFVFDNSYPDGFDDVKAILEDVRDPRCSYSANRKNFGPQENYRRCFAAVARYPYGMVLPADIGLLPRSLEILIGSLQAADAEIAFSPATLFEGLHEAAEFTSGLSKSSSKLETYGTKTIPAVNLVGEFFGNRNMGGEYTNFSVFGALGEGDLFRRLALLRSPYRFHGWEFQNSMLFASQARQINLLDQKLQVAVTGLKKYAGTQRPESDWTRLEPILATFETANRIREENSHFASQWSFKRIKEAHSKLLAHYSRFYGQHKVASSLMRIILCSGLTNSRALSAFFSAIIRFRFQSR